MLTATRLLVPDLDDRPWPTLGPEICDFIEDLLVHGPGDKLGEPAELTDEERLFIYRSYEVYPHGHARAGRRRFKRAGYSRRKGVGKTELAQWISICELDPEAPVRCDGFRKQGRGWIPVGRPVHDPYIPMIAVTKQQVGDLAFGGVKAIIEHPKCLLVNDYDTGEERITHAHAPGKMQLLAAAPDARDGARTTYQHFDECHGLRGTLHDAHGRMLENVPKRLEADAWSLETATAFVPGEESVAEDTFGYAVDIAEGRIADAALFYDHRQASKVPDFDNEDEVRQCIVEASGPDALAYSDIEGIVELTRQPKIDRSEWIRLWLNRPEKRALSWIDMAKFDAKRHPEGLTWPPAKSPVVLMFDGSYSRDSTALLGATVAARPHLFVIKAWEKPKLAPQWRTPRAQVELEIDKSMHRWSVLEFAGDPPGWHREFEDWEATYGDVVVRFETNQARVFGPACELFFNSVMETDEEDTDVVEFTHDGNSILRRHLNNAVPVLRRGYTVITKESADSPDKIDVAVAAIGALTRSHWHHLHRPKRRRGGKVH